MKGEEVSEALGRDHLLGEGLARLLEVPDGIREIGPLSFSTGSMSATALEGCFLLGLPLPEGIPHYAIALSQKGNCILIDKRRRIIVMGEVGGRSGFSGFEINLLMALDEAPQEGRMLLLSEEVERSVRDQA